MFLANRMFMLAFMFLALLFVLSADHQYLSGIFMCISLVSVIHRLRLDLIDLRKDVECLKKGASGSECQEKVNSKFSD
jgi:hypothetical protein